MEPIEIIVIISAIAIVALVIGRYIYKRIKHMPVGECSCCSSKMKKNFKRIANEIKLESKCGSDNCTCNSNK